MLPSCVHARSVLARSVRYVVSRSTGNSEGGGGENEVEEGVRKGRMWGKGKFEERTNAGKGRV